MQPLEYTAAQRDKVLDDLFAMLPSHNGLVIERLYHSNRRYAIRSFANPAESVDSVTVVKFGTGDGFSKDDTPRDTHSIERYLEQARDWIFFFGFFIFVLLDLDISCSL